MCALIQYIVKVLGPMSLPRGSPRLTARKHRSVRWVLAQQPRLSCALPTCRAPQVQRSYDHYRNIEVSLVKLIMKQGLRGA